MSRVHFVSAPEPVREGSDVEANCSVIVKQAHFVDAFESPAMGQKFELPEIKGACRKCLQAEKSGKYVSAVCELLEEERRDHEEA